MTDGRIEAVAALWTAHLQAPFPPRLRGAEIAGIDMVLLDADTAGCVSTWLNHHGQLDPWRQAVIAACLAELNTVLPQLDGIDADYYRRLRELAALICSPRADPAP
jgi:hypothetical protein